jgi:cob(I)alamin adenosyltransferase
MEKTCSSKLANCKMENFIRIITTEEIRIVAKTSTSSKKIIRTTQFYVNRLSLLVQIVSRIIKRRVSNQIFVISIKLNEDSPREEN